MVPGLRFPEQTDNLAYFKGKRNSLPSERHWKRGGGGKGGYERGEKKIL